MKFISLERCYLPFPKEIITVQHKGSFCYICFALLKRLYKPWQYRPPPSPRIPDYTSLMIPGAYRCGLTAPISPRYHQGYIFRYPGGGVWPILPRLVQALKQSKTTITKRAFDFNRYAFFCKGKVTSFTGYQLHKDTPLLRLCYYYRGPT